MPFLDENALHAAATETLDRLLGPGHRLQRLPGGASLRRYYRVTGAARSLLIMETGEPGHSDEVVKGAAPTELPFINVQRYLAKAAAPVPELYHHDVEGGLLFLEDLGDITFESMVANADDATRRRWYTDAIDVLVGIQRYAAAHPDPACIAFGRSFDFDLLHWELEHFREYGLEAQGHVLSPAERALFDEYARRIAEELAALPRGFVHRDYQSRNLMITDGKIRVIDFQDALLGSDAYDLVGLLRDSYIVLSDALLDELVDIHAARAGHDRDAFRRRFHLQTVQRKLKDSGRFVFIEQVKKLPGFMQHIPASLGYVRRAFSELPELAPLQQMLASHLPLLQRAM